jgi:hypothetical protein
VTPGFVKNGDRLKVELLGGNRWRLLEPLRYDSAVLGCRLTVPDGFETDFASVPRLPLAYLIAGNRFHAPAAVHDFLYSRGFTTRKEADDVLYEAMRSEGDSRTFAFIVWTAVRTFGRGRWDG